MEGSARRHLAPSRTTPPCGHPCTRLLAIVVTPHRVCLSLSRSSQVLPLVIVKEPEPDFFKDEGGKNNYLTFVVQSPYPIEDVSQPSNGVACCSSQRLLTRR